MENTIANIRILDLVRLVHGYFIFVFLIINMLSQGFQSGPVPGTFTRLRSCIVPAEITEPPKISGGQNHKYDGR
jgi:hypothetical protein